MTGKDIQEIQALTLHNLPPGHGAGSAHLLAGRLSHVTPARGSCSSAHAREAT